MWVYLDTRSCGNCVCVEVQPNMTALEMTYCVIREAKRMDGECGSEQNLYLHEVVLGGMMERPIHHSEIMLEVTLKWGQWSEPDRRENYLLLKSNTFYSEALPCALPPMSVFGEAYFSDNKPGKATFKKHQVRVCTKPRHFLLWTCTVTLRFVFNFEYSLLSVQILLLDW